MRRVNIRGVAAVFMTEPYFKVVEQVAKKEGFKSTNDFFTHKYYVHPGQVMSGYDFACHAVDSIIAQYLERPLTQKGLDPAELLRHVNVGSEYVLGEPD
jgi:hypothetical protein